MNEIPNLHRAAITGNLIDVCLESSDIDEKYEGGTALFYATHARNFITFKLLIKVGAHIHFSDDIGRTVLHWCAYYNFLEGLQFLCKYNTLDLDCIDHAGQTALHIASSKGYIDIVQSLIDQGATLDILDFSNSSPAHYAIINEHLNVVRYFQYKLGFIESRTNLFGKNFNNSATGRVKDYLNLVSLLQINPEEENKILEICLSMQQKPAEDAVFAIEQLITYKSNVIIDEKILEIFKNLKFACADYVSEFYMALFKTQDHEYIKNTVNKYLTIQEKQHLFYFAAESGYKDIIGACKNYWKLDMTICNSQGLSAVHLACLNGHCDFLYAVRDFLGNHVWEELINSVSSDCKSILHLAAINDNVEIFRFFKKNDPGCFKNLLLKKDVNENTLVHVCVIHNAQKTLTYLIKNPIIAKLIANDIYNKKGHTPQHIAAKNGNINLFKLLWQCHANFSAKTDYLDSIQQKSVLDLAIKYNHVKLVEFLLHDTKLPIFSEPVYSTDELNSIDALKHKKTIKNIFNMHKLLLKSQNGIFLNDDLERTDHLLKFENQTPSSCDSHQRNDVQKIDSLVFQGGGVKGIAYCGAIEAYAGKQKNEWLKGIKRVAGTSAGAITALLLSLGYDLKSMKKEMTELDFNSLIEERHREFVFALKSQNWAEILGGDLFQLSQALLSSKYNVFEKFASIVTRSASAILSGLSLKNTISELYGVLNTEFGLFKGNVLLAKFQKWIEEKTGDKNITFSELEKFVSQSPASSDLSSFKSLYAIGYSLNDKIQIFSAEHTPNVIVAHAIRISMSIPIFFAPHCIHRKIDGEVVVDRESGLFIDGGIAKNFHLNIFDDTKYLCEPQFNRGSQPIKNPHVLGFKLFSDEDRRFYDQTQAKNIPMNSSEEKFFGYVRKVIAAVMDVQSSNFILKKDDFDRTVLINSSKVGTVDFDLDEIKIGILMKAGETGVLRYKEEQEDSKRIFSLEPQVKYKIKRILLDGYLTHIPTQVANSMLLENLWSDNQSNYHTPLLLFRIFRISGLTSENFCHICHYFCLNISSLDTNLNNLAHLLAKEGEINHLNKLLDIKPNLFIHQNNHGITPLYLYYLYHYHNKRDEVRHFFHCFEIGSTIKEYIDTNFTYNGNELHYISNKVDEEGENLAQSRQLAI